MTQKLSASLLEYDARGLSAVQIGEARGLAPLEEREGELARLERARAAVFAAHERGELGFLSCFETGTEELLGWADEVREKGRFTHQIVLGIGGSSLGALAVLASTGRPRGAEGALETIFSENVDPRSFARDFASLPLSKTLIVIISKSGTTIETMSKFWILYEALIDEVGEAQAAKHVVAITDPEKGSLRKIAEARGFTTFPVPPNVGGRFSVLTAVGLVPLALAGYDVRGLLDGARAVRTHVEQSDIAHDLTAQVAADQVALLQKGISQVVMMPYCDDLLALADWFRQLWAESLGKRVNRKGEEVCTGITPLKALGVIDQHSQVQLYMEGPADKHVTFIEVARLEEDEDFVVPSREGFPSALAHLQGKSLGELLAAELEGTARALGEAGRPTSRWRLARISPQSVGAFILAWEMVTAIAGELLDIDAFDQPGVELGKKIAHALLGAPDQQTILERMEEQGEEKPGDEAWVRKVTL